MVEKLLLLARWRTKKPVVKTGGIFYVFISFSIQIKLGERKNSKSVTKRSKISASDKEIKRPLFIPAKLGRVEGLV